MSITGTLTINLGISRLDGTRLMKGDLNNEGFGRATTFLRQDRKLKKNQTIFVDGEDDVFQGPVIVITDAGPAGAESFAAAGSKDIAASASGVSGAAAVKDGRKAAKAGAKRSNSKQSGSKKRARAAKKGAGKGSKHSAKKSRR
jgi:hypothetical protein